jgi:hypothetical protein
VRAGATQAPARCCLSASALGTGNTRTGRTRTMIMDAAVVAATLALTHVTYVDAMKDREPHLRPHRVAIRAVRTAVVVAAGVCLYHGRWVYWQLAVLLPARQVTHETDQEVSDSE